MNNLFENRSKEPKYIFLLEDFNVNFLTENEHSQIKEILNSLTSNSFIPLILHPARITSHGNILIDNIFSNVADPDVLSGSVTDTISGYLSHFSVVPTVFGNI